LKQSSNTHQSQFQFNSNFSAAASQLPDPVSLVKSALKKASQLPNLVSSYVNLPSAEHSVASMLRVDYAGEYSTQRIFDGQLRVLQQHSHGPIIQELQDQEIQHLRNLAYVIPKHRIRPTTLLPIWDVAGFALGFGSALLGPRYAIACTVAVEKKLYVSIHNSLVICRFANSISQFNRSL
jgi:demethoxyubiquinone hydroxylase (CLK1/Coq7/Cat5 family)